MALGLTSVVAQKIVINSIDQNGSISFLGAQVGTTATVDWAANLTEVGRTNWHTLKDLVVTASNMTTDIPMFFRVRGIPSLEIIEDFENYTVGLPIDGQGGWSWWGGDCGPVVVANDLTGSSKCLRSDSCYWAQWAARNVHFRFNASMSNTYLQISSKIRSGGGNNCCSEVYLYDLAAQYFIFGMIYNHANSQAALTFATSANSEGVIAGVLSMDTWYDIRSNIDWTQVTSDTTATASLQYKESDSSIWNAVRNVGNEITRITRCNTDTGLSNGWNRLS